jgi:hypothetical protein
MKHALTFALLGLIGVAPGLGQTGQTDSQTLQAILVEMRSLHNDVRLSQTTQILLTELEVQETAVSRAMQKRDDTRNRLTQEQANEKNMTSQIARFDDPTNASVDPQQRKQMSQMIDSFRAQLPAIRIQQQDASTDLQDAENALRKEQETLAGIQDQLNAVVKKLQPAATQ